MPGGTTVCSGSACDVTCASGNYHCGPDPQIGGQLSCNPRVLNFDSGLQGFVLQTPDVIPTG
ncbi:MAG TPA: hypothetical protein VLU24_10410, partial [Mycobacterium sp.]|nr:hypothetical protein [Mycobacterium sp.]